MSEATTPKIEIPQLEPFLGQEEISEVVDCIRTNWLTEGPKSAKFVQLLQQYTGAKHILLIPNGTLALYVALKVAGLGAGDEVIVPDFTFFASGSSVVLAGATPVFVDIEPGTLNIDPEQIRKAISSRTKAIMPVHIYGQAANMDLVMKIAEENNLAVIEDAAQGIGVFYRGRHVGTIGDLGCMSFFADKTMTTGEGGAILTNDDGLAEKALYFKNQGRLNRGSFVHPFMGYNFRLTDIQSAIGVAQMKRLPELIARKQRADARYRENLADLSQIQFLSDAPGSNRVPFRIGILVPEAEPLAHHLTNVGIGLRSFFYPMHRQPAFTPANCRVLPRICHSVHGYEHGICLPSSASLTDSQIDFICEQIREFYAD